MPLSIRPSDGYRLNRKKETVEVPLEVVKAANESYDTKEPRVAEGFDTEKEAKTVLAKLRTHLNKTGRGTDAKVYEEHGVWGIEFLVRDKRDVSPKATRLVDPINPPTAPIPAVNEPEVGELEDEDDTELEGVTQTDVTVNKEEDVLDVLETWGASVR